MDNNNNMGNETPVVNESSTGNETPVGNDPAMGNAQMNAGMGFDPYTGAPVNASAGNNPAMGNAQMNTGMGFDPYTGAPVNASAGNDPYMGSYPAQDIYAQPYGVQMQPKQSTALAIVSLILGILSILLNCCCAVLGFVLGVTAIILACVYRKNNDGQFGGLALAGLICGCVGIATMVISLAFGIASGFSGMSYLEDYMDF